MPVVYRSVLKNVLTTKGDLQKGNAICEKIYLLNCLVKVLIMVKKTQIKAFLWFCYYCVAFSEISFKMLFQY